uniref:Retrotransposon gag domain-containing protein n=1 Tax=Tanacetum cinerariifolium TaxID=118510 RepID=A0A6L2NE99_TANCI|nr:hypothetical protein [Tanacetum cinerariifolium]
MEAIKLVHEALDDPESPPPSPLSTHLFATYQKVTAEADLTKRERALITVLPYKTKVGKTFVSVAATSQGETTLTVCMTRVRGQFHTTLEDMDSYPAACLEELAVFMTKWDVKPQVKIDQWETLLEDPIDELISRFRQKMALRRQPTVNQNPPVNRSTIRNTSDINSGIDAQMVNQLIATRVAEALTAAAVTHATSIQEETNLRSNTSQNKLESQFKISNITEGDRVKFTSSTLLDSALTWWNLYVHFVTLNATHITTWNDFKAMFIWKYYPRNKVMQTENELSNLKELGENSRDKQKWNDNHYNNKNTNNIGNFNPNKCPKTKRVFTARQGQDIRPRNVELYLVLQAKEDPIPNEDKEESRNPRRNNQASTSNQGGSKEAGRIYHLCAEAAVHDNNVVKGVAPVARALYHLAPAELKELAEQLKDLSDKGFIRTSSSP